MLLLIDNYDSFTWNLVQYFGALGQEVVVKRNDELTLDNFIELLQCDELKGVAAQVIQKIDRAASDPDSFVKKKSPSLSTGSSENGSLTAAPETKTSKRAAKA